jgi:hypothetical protein
MQYDPVMHVIGQLPRDAFRGVSAAWRAGRREKMRD